MWGTDGQNCIRVLHVRSTEQKAYEHAMCPYMFAWQYALGSRLKRNIHLVEATTPRPGPQHLARPWGGATGPAGL